MEEYKITHTHTHIPILFLLTWCVPDMFHVTMYNWCVPDIIHVMMYPWYIPGWFHVMLYTWRVQCTPYLVIMYTLFVLSIIPSDNVHLICCKHHSTFHLMMYIWCVPGNLCVQDYSRGECRPRWAPECGRQDYFGEVLSV